MPAGAGFDCLRISGEIRYLGLLRNAKSRHFKFAGESDCALHRALGKS